MPNKPSNVNNCFPCKHYVTILKLIDLIVKQLSFLQTVTKKRVYSKYNIHDIRLGRSTYSSNWWNACEEQLFYIIETYLLLKFNFFILYYSRFHLTIVNKRVFVGIVNWFWVRYLYFNMLSELKEIQTDSNSHTSTNV